MLNLSRSFIIIWIATLLTTPSYGMFLFEGISKYFVKEPSPDLQEIPQNKSDSILETFALSTQGERLCEVHHESVSKNRSVKLSQKANTYKLNFLNTMSPFISVFVDSTYLHPNSIPSIGEKMHVLDGGVVKRYVLQNKAFYGVGFGDGYGGHWDALDDKGIAAMSRYAPEAILDLTVNNLTCRKEFELLDIREQLYHAFIESANKLKNTKEYKRTQAGTTLSCSLIFECEDGYQIIGFNYGDQRISRVTKNKKKKLKFESISDGGQVSYVPKYPDLIGPVEVEYLPFEKVIKSEDFIIFSTDGVVLPELESIDNSTGLNVKTVKAEEVSRALREAFIDTAQDVNTALIIKYSYAFINQKRKEKLRQGRPDGDDVLSIVFGPINSDMFSIEHEFTSIEGNKVIRPHG